MGGLCGGGVENQKSKGPTEVRPVVAALDCNLFAQRPSFLGLEPDACAEQVRVEYYHR